MFYNIQLYDKDWVFKKNIPSILIKNEVVFDWNVNGSLWDLTISFNLPFSNDDFTISDIIQVYFYTEENKVGTLIYKGAIKDIDREANTVGEEITIRCQGLLRYFARKLFRDSLNSVAWNIVGNPSDIIKDMIDQINVEFPWAWITYAGGLIDLYPTNIALNFDKTSCLSALQTIQEITKRDFYIRTDWEFIFRPTPITPTHILTYKKDIERLKVNETADWLANRVFLTWSSFTWLFNEIPSQWDYGLFEVVESDSSANSQPTVDLWAENIANERKNPQREISITINNKFDFTQLIPWDTVAITNVNYPITNAKIVKINYKNGRMELGLDRYVGIGKSILSLIKRF